MTVVLAILFGVSCLTSAVSVFGAQFEADHLKATGVVEKDTPNILVWISPSGGIERLYSDLYKRYPSDRVRKLVKIARISIPAGWVLWVSLMLAQFVF